MLATRVKQMFLQSLKTLSAAVQCALLGGPMPRNELLARGELTLAELGAYSLQQLG